MPSSLLNKKIIISAGASGIGWTTAKILLSRGATIYLCDIDNKYLNKIRKHPLSKKNYLHMNVMLLMNMRFQIFLTKLEKKQKKLTL